jgi:hypothetical protein
MADEVATFATDSIAAGCLIGMSFPYCKCDNTAFQHTETVLTTRTRKCSGTNVKLTSIG